MENDIIIINDSYEIHPTIKGGYAIVNSKTGEVVATFATLAEANLAAKSY